MVGTCDSGNVVLYPLYFLESRAVDKKSFFTIHFNAIPFFSLVTEIFVHSKFHTSMRTKSSFSFRFWNFLAKLGSYLLPRHIFSVHL